MTIAIASKCIGGTVMIADKEITLADGSKTIGDKIYSRDFKFGTVTLASATEDGLAAESLAENIFAHLGNLTTTHGTVSGVVEMVRDEMQRWHGAYTAGTTPALSYLLVISAFGNQELYVIEPPRTVLSKHAYAIGSGARVAQPILDRLIPGGDVPAQGAAFQPRTSMMFLAYMAKRAATETAMVGGGFDGLFMPIIGRIRRAASLDMMFAEEMVFTVDQCLDRVLFFLMSLTDEEDREKSAIALREDMIFVSSQLAKQEPFESLTKE